MATSGGGGARHRNQAAPICAVCASRAISNHAVAVHGVLLGVCSPCYLTHELQLEVACRRRSEEEQAFLAAALRFVLQLATSQDGAGDE